MSDAELDADEVARMVAEKADREMAEGARAEAARAQAAAGPIRPSARSRWRFGVECRESSGDATLVIRCYPRKIAHSEDDSPLSVGSRGYLIRMVALVIVLAICVWIDNRSVVLPVLGTLLAAFIFAHYARTVHVRITPRGHFLVYEGDPRRPIALGPLRDLRMDVHGEAHGAYNSMRCGWVADGQTPSFGLSSLPPADWLKVKAFIARYRLRGL